MGMFCFQCQEAAKNLGCTTKGVCGKEEGVANLQDLLIYNLKGFSQILCSGSDEKSRGIAEKGDTFIVESLFATITNANFDEDYFIQKVAESFALKKDALELVSEGNPGNYCLQKKLHNAATLQLTEKTQYYEEAEKIGVLATENEDVRSLRELVIYGLKGIAAYYHHAQTLGFKDPKIVGFMKEALAATLNNDLSVDELTTLVLKCGESGVSVMALLDKANTESYGKPEPTEVNLGVGTKPGILISGHDLKDMEELLDQTNGTGVDVYTHGEMLPAHYYPAFKKYSHFKGNYGGSWWSQHKEFGPFNGPILMTTNCIVPPKDSYRDRIYTTGVAGFKGLKHISDRVGQKPKDFSSLIEQAKKCSAPEELETGSIVGGFAHDYVLSIADKILEAIKTGAVKKFVVMAGCDGRKNTRNYYTDFAEGLEKDAIILTAGCAKYRYNKLNLGDIGGIPRVLDAGQCNDSYSLAVIALKLAEVLNVGVNELPIVYNIAWYEQKAVIVLLALLYLGVKDIHLGPTLPAFLSPNVVNVLVENFGISGINDVSSDLKNF